MAITKESKKSNKNYWQNEKNLVYCNSCWNTRKQFKKMAAKK